MKVHDDFDKKSRLGDTSRWYVNSFVRAVSSGVPRGHRLLDAGAGECAYKRYFAHCLYTAVDLAVGDARWNYRNIDCITRLHELCFREESFDVVLCTQVLEHLEWPRESVKEFHRVLKPGGRLLMTVPMAQNEHQTPYDFFRYTSFGVRSLCERAGFRDVKIGPFGGLFVRWAYELPRLLDLMPPIGITKGTFYLRDLLLFPAKTLLLLGVRVFQVLLFGMDRFDRGKHDTLGWSIIATK